MGGWGTGRGWRHAVARCEGSGASAAWPAAAQSRRMTSIETGEGGAERWAPATVLGGSGLHTFQIQTNSNYFKTFQTLTDPKMDFPRPKKLK
jgi:hypothetical protein